MLKNNQQINEIMLGDKKKMNLLSTPTNNLLTTNEQITVLEKEILQIDTQLDAK